MNVVNQVSPFVSDKIWLGIANDLLARLTLNGETAPATKAIARPLMQKQSNGFIWELYFQYKDNPQIEWKDSIKGVVGLDI